MKWRFIAILWVLLIGAYEVLSGSRRYVIRRFRNSIEIVWLSVFQFSYITVTVDDTAYIFGIYFVWDVTHPLTCRHLAWPFIRAYSSIMNYCLVSLEDSWHMNDSCGLNKTFRILGQKDQTSYMYYYFWLKVIGLLLCVYNRNPPRCFPTNYYNWWNIRE